MTERVVIPQRQLVRAQHIVPQWHLRRFADAGGWFWRYKQNEPPRRRRPKGECWERDFYEYDVNGTRTENRYENWLGRIENRAAPLLEVLLNQQQLNREDMVVWSSYVASLFLRTQKVRSQLSAAMVQKFGAQSQDPDFIRDFQYDLFREGKLVYAEDLKKRFQRLRNDMDNSPSFYHLSGLERHTVSLGNALIAKTWRVIQAPPGKFFVISDSLFRPWRLHLVEPFLDRGSEKKLLPFFSRSRRNICSLHPRQRYPGSRSEAPPQWIRPTASQSCLLSGGYMPT